MRFFIDLCWSFALAFCYLLFLSDIMRDVWDNDGFLHIILCNMLSDMQSI